MLQNSTRGHVTQQRIVGNNNTALAARDGRVSTKSTQMDRVFDSELRVTNLGKGRGEGGRGLASETAERSPDKTDCTEICTLLLEACIPFFP